MTDDEIVVILGMPTDEGLREVLAHRRQRQGKGFLKPVIYTGSVKQPCTGCGLELYVGPRQQAALVAIHTSRLLCLWCAEQRAAVAEAVTVDHLDNPEGAIREE